MSVLLVCTRMIKGPECGESETCWGIIARKFSPTLSP